MKELSDDEALEAIAYWNATCDAADTQRGELLRWLVRKGRVDLADVVPPAIERTDPIMQHRSSRRARYAEANAERRANEGTEDAVLP